MKPNDICQPSDECVGLIRRYLKTHRGIVVSYPDRFECVKVIWQHDRKRKPTMMAGRYIEPARVKEVE